MWDKVPQVLARAGRFSLPLRALKALGLSTILSPYYKVNIAVTAGVSGSNPRAKIVTIESGSVIMVKLRRQGAVAVRVLG
jgi:hypothetical protein